MDSCWSSSGAIQLYTTAYISSWCSLPHLFCSERLKYFKSTFTQSPTASHDRSRTPMYKELWDRMDSIVIRVLFRSSPLWADGPTFRPKANKLGGQKQFPYMVDPNTKTSMYESDAIINYLFESYGEGSKVCNVAVSPSDMPCTILFFTSSIFMLRLGVSEWSASTVLAVVYPKVCCFWEVLLEFALHPR